VASAPGSPWGGAEGLTNNPWSGLLTRRMLAQGGDWGNAAEKETRATAERTPRQQGINTGTSTDACLAVCRNALLSADNAGFIGADDPGGSALLLQLN